jgi:hypothetical protein
MESISSLGSSPKSMSDNGNPFHDQPPHSDADSLPGDRLPPEDYARKLYEMQLRAEERRLREETRQMAIARRNEILRRVQQAAYYLIAALQILLGMHFVLQLTGANPTSPFAQGIGFLASPYIAPFSTLFPVWKFGTFNVLNLNTIVAMVTYALLGVLFGRLIKIVSD